MNFENNISTPIIQFILSGELIELSVYTVRSRPGFSLRVLFSKRRGGKWQSFDTKMKKINKFAVKIIETFNSPTVAPTHLLYDCSRQISQFTFYLFIVQFTLQFIEI